ncbi:MAG: large subunit ribosomal protein [Chloroflexota bacterium]|jgi:large subunit ribosomal protein L10|nr:large subunit ribosomal protein [Chloroflexota bacterium]
MPTEAKRAKVAELVEAFSGSQAAVVTDYRGLTVTDLGKVRRDLRDKGVRFTVVKNRLGKIAAQQADRVELADLLVGPSAVAVGGSDEAALARAVLDALRPYRQVSVRGAVVGHTRVEPEAVTRLASLPSREILLAQLAGGIASPLATMASLLSAPLRNLGYALQQVRDQREASQATGGAQP